MELGVGFRRRPLELSLASAALVMLGLSAVAFWPGYLSQPAAADGYTHLHAALGTLWLSILVAQPLLIRAGKRRAHRGVGRLAGVVGVAFVLSAVLPPHHRMGRMGAAQFAREGHAFYLPLVMAAIFAASLALGFKWRSSVKVHGRFMACTLLPLLDPVLARITFFHAPPLPSPVLYQVPAFLLAGAVLFGLSASLPENAPGRAAFRAFAAGTVGALLLYFLTPYSSAWWAFMSWFRSLPIT